MQANYWWGQMHCGPSNQSFRWAIAYPAHAAAHIYICLFVSASDVLFVACSRQNFDSANQLNVNLTIPRPNNVHDFKLVGIHSSRYDRTLASIALPTTLVVPPYIGNITFHS